ncbi:hypothetical protein EDC14_1004165 [Hydrogenispora ethanolica]|uniref:SPP1 Gp6-like portal protein n=1 Tax=Hydrogenispora ethanolica TaxID=1082276 RepID=A0A4V2QG30_HYDET|nr:hypothetical protein [Hydrogenispora ethanolica]TCL74227.1 hypothetical protein EDC14_1004165 [Hydrogenispora ethanolica]
MNVLQNDREYKFLTDAYYGIGGFKDGSYLDRHPRETDAKYQRRREASYYLNYVAPVVNSHVDPVFRKKPEQDWRDNKLFDLFMSNTDMLGTPFHRYMKRAALIAKLNAVAFVVVDNVPDQPTTIAEAIRQRALPYAYIVKPHQVREYETNDIGALIRLTYEVAPGDLEGLTKGKTTLWTWTDTEWSCKSGGEEKTGSHSLGRVPIVPLYSRPMEPGVVLPPSDFYSIARANKRLFNLCSEIDELIRNQAFAILTYPRGESQDNDELKEVITGTENMLSYDGALSNRPEFTAPPADQLQQLREERQDLIQEIYRMAELSHVTGVQEKKSGVAKAWDFEQTNQTLSDFAQNCEQAEREIATLFELWTNTAVGFTTQYSDDFGLVDVQAELDKVSAALDLNVGGRFNVAVKKKAVFAYLNDLKDEEFDEIIQDIDSRAQDETYNFNGAQVSSAVEVLMAVAGKQIAPETAKLMLMSFFGIDEERAGQMVNAQMAMPPVQQDPTQGNPFGGNKLDELGMNHAED